MQLVAEKVSGVVVVRVAQDRIDAACAIQFKDQMRALAQAGSPKVLLDLQQVAFIDSSGLGAIVAVMKALAPAQKLELSGLTSTVKKVFRLTRMDSIFTIHDALPQHLAQAG
ncbi:MAG: STAS domain-containing protein [Cypionkella sp.]|jgi:anti-sigma B factor antagonist